MCRLDRYRGLVRPAQLRCVRPQDRVSQVADTLTRGDSVHRDHGDQFGPEEANESHTRTPVQYGIRYAEILTILRQDITG